MGSSVPPHIVRLDAMHCEDPTFSPDFEHTYANFPNTVHQDEVIIERLTEPKEANVVITTRIPINEAILSACPNLKLVAAMAIGVDMIDLAACKRHGVKVVNVPAASNESVSEHAIALFFSLRRQVVRMHEALMEDGGKKWVERGSLRDEWGECPGTCREEKVVIFGGGELGNRVSTVCKALDMTVNFADRKGIPTSSVRNGRLPFDQALQTGTVFFLTLPLTPETHNMISTPELISMHPDALIINVARGGIINEEALVTALKERKISGVATDVYEVEPAGEVNSPLVKAAVEWKGDEGMRGRLVLSPHLAWWGRASIVKLRTTVAGNIEKWVRGEVVNEVL